MALVGDRTFQCLSRVSIVSANISWHATIVVNAVQFASSKSFECTESDLLRPDHGQIPHMPRARVWSRPFPETQNIINGNRLTKSCTRPWSSQCYFTQGLDSAFQAQYTFEILRPHKPQDKRNTMPMTERQRLSSGEKDWRVCQHDNASVCFQQCQCLHDLMGKSSVHPLVQRFCARRPVQ